MTKLDALKRSIEIAVERGFVNNTAKLNWEKQRVEFSGHSQELGYFIFSHQFAKGLFGYKNICPDCGGRYGVVGLHGEIKTVPAWQKHLTLMVLYEDPLDYLVEYLGKEKA